MHLPSLWPDFASFLSPGIRLPPSHCLSQYDTLERAIACLDLYTVPKDTYNTSTYATSQPTFAERIAWRDTITALSAGGRDSTGACVTFRFALPVLLKDIYTISAFTDIPSNTSYCILHELHAFGTNPHHAHGQYLKGWGTLVVPSSLEAVKRHLHISAPHPAYDLGTPIQAAALFQSTGAKSLLVAGRSRLAYTAPTGCVETGTRGETYYATDPAHNKLEPFYDASLAIYTAQLSHPHGCPETHCAFIQLHGKSASTCPTDHIFLSAGLGKGSSSLEWYASPSPRPVKRLQAALRTTFPHWNVSLPFDRLSCALTATKNVVGRLLNGVPDSDVCATPARAEGVEGYFIHAEQAAAARFGKDVWEKWAQALKRAFAEVDEDDVASNKASR
ncbi:hypothetical protein DXG03_009545 [Asterophora parasitica]|uniref:Uncharacterized protein n=1 Tax=Asterophora parasitica TaxID=117018 RepID=A0A9P7KDH0_9AGAR|nr:hypothetical protein DXG03_009545 [Asterophora parasitica]